MKTRNTDQNGHRYFMRYTVLSDSIFIKKKLNFVNAPIVAMQTQYSG
jgi:hypothetical protein